MSPADVIPWWGWIAMWGGLTLALLAMLVLFAWWLFRKGMVVLDNLDDLADITAKLDAVDATPPARARPAVLDDFREVRAARDRQTALRDRRRSARYAERMARARRITDLDATTQQWPDSWGKP